MNFDGIEGCESTFDSCRTTTVRNTVVIERSRTALPNENPAPISDQRRLSSSRVACVERPAKSIARIVQTRHDNRKPIRAFGDQRSAIANFDS